jgi:hypothetical protein
LFQQVDGKIHQVRNGRMRHGIGGIGGNVAHENLSGSAGLQGKVVVPRPGLAQEFHRVWKVLDGLCMHVHFLGDDNFRLMVVDQCHDVLQAYDVILIVSAKIGHGLQAGKVELSIIIQSGTVQKEGDRALSLLLLGRREGRKVPPKSTRGSSRRRMM